MNAVLAGPSRSPRTKLPLSFIAVAVLMYTIDGAIVHSSRFLAHPGATSAAASLDLTIGVTAAYWLLAVRRGLATLRTIVPVFIASVVAATLTLPPGHRDLVRDIRYLGTPFELAIIALIVIGARRARRRLAASGIELDVPERIRLVLGESGMQSRIVDVFATETAMFYFALASWRRGPFVPTGAIGFSSHKRNGYAALLFALVPITFVESFVVDLVVRVHHPLAANILLAFDMFAAIWILGLARSVQLRPTLLTAETLHVRNGLQWRLDVPRDAIERIDVGRVSAPPKRTPGYLRATFGQPNVLVELREPLRAHGPYGLSRAVTHIGLFVDDLPAFRNATTVG